ncbi:helix-turn-helix domain-containing protein [Lacticaseibacillus daqingensis]|uniref:helix-turn-helix domain-containing protein n=1 Tax=Lacticaseibacillus daqingensis TaxID=2486014 RepID=UPI000F7677C5|nr:helix-turn-helix transcriptional regulator [Lacticaseibacillus daqingensis]
MKLQEARIAAGLTQEELAARSHRSVSMVQSIENGRRDGSTKTLMAFAEALGTTPNVLLYGVDHTNRTSGKEVTR